MLDSNLNNSIDSTEEVHSDINLKIMAAYNAYLPEFVFDPDFITEIADNLTMFDVKSYPYDLNCKL
jgi:hypothetical protein